MKILAPAFVLYLILNACGGSSQPEDRSKASANPDTSLKSAPADERQQCYVHINGRDSVHMAISLKADSVHGSLYFNNYQIDDSRGRIAGRFQSDTLFVVYDFMAEGMHNRTEEAFLKRGDSLIRGFGVRHLVNETMRYQKSDTINFGKGQVFLPVTCP